MSIPIKNPTSDIRDTAVLAGLKLIAGNDAAAMNLFNAMSDGVKTANYQAFRTMAIGQVLEADQALTSKKIKVSKFFVRPDGVAMATGAVDPCGLASIAGYAGDGCVTVIVPVAVKVHADDVAGLVA